MDAIRLGSPGNDEVLSTFITYLHHVLIHCKQVMRLERLSDALLNMHRTTERQNTLSPLACRTGVVYVRCGDNLKYELAVFSI